MKYILKKKIEGIDWEVGETKLAGLITWTRFIGNNTNQTGLVNPVDIHNLLLNGTIEKVEEKQVTIKELIIKSHESTNN